MFEKSCDSKLRDNPNCLNEQLFFSFVPRLEKPTAWFENLEKIRDFVHCVVQLFCQIDIGMSTVEQ
jgi:hypothetical protein